MPRSPTAQAYLQSRHLLITFSASTLRPRPHSSARSTITPTKYLYWANLGDAYRWVPGQRQNRRTPYDQAIHLCRGELHLNASDTVTRARLAECLAKRGDPKTADRKSQQALAADPTNRSNACTRRRSSQTSKDMTPKQLRWLTNAVEHGYNRSQNVSATREFAMLRNSDSYKQAFPANATMTAGQQHYQRGRVHARH